MKQKRAEPKRTKATISCEHCAEIGVKVQFSKTEGGKLLLEQHYLAWHTGG